MFNFGYIPKEVIKEHNSNWQEIPGHPYRILLIVRGSGSGKNALLNLINNESEIDKDYLYAKDLYEAKYQFSIKTRETRCSKYFNDSKARILKWNKKCTPKPYSFLVIDATLASDNSLRFRKNLLERI